MYYILLSFGKTNKCVSVSALLYDGDDPTKESVFAGAAEDLGFGSHYIDSVQAFRSYDALDKTCRMVENGVVAVFGPRSEENAHIVESVCLNKDIPHIETRWNYDPSKSTNTLNVHPHGPTLARAFADLVESANWDTFTLFFEDNDSLTRISEILKRDREFSIAIKQLDGNGTANYRPLLKEVLKSGHNHFVIDCHIDRLTIVLQQAQQVGLMTSDYHYFITNLDLQTIDMEPYKYSGSNISGVRLTLSIFCRYLSSSGDILRVFFLVLYYIVKRHFYV